jgi:hypothetical protein
MGDTSFETERKISFTTKFADPGKSNKDSIALAGRKLEFWWQPNELPAQYSELPAVAISSESCFPTARQLH